MDIICTKYQSSISLFSVRSLSISGFRDENKNIQHKYRYKEGEQLRMIRILTDEPYRVNLEYDDLKFSLHDELGEEIDMNVEELLWTAPPKNLSNSRKNPIRFLDPPAVVERDATRLGEICKERFGNEWDIVSIKSPGHVLSLVEEAKRIGLDLGLNATPLAIRRMRRYENFSFFFHYSREHWIDFLEHTHKIQ